MAYAVFKDPNDLDNGDMVVFDSGRLDIYNKIDGMRSAIPTTPLKKYKAGAASIGSWTELPGYWQEQPRVLVSVKKVPTYYARGRLGQQRFTLSCEVQSTGTPLKYRIRPVLTFYIGSGGSGTITVNETHDTYTYSGRDDANNSTLTFADLITTPQSGSGTLNLSISWRTRATGTNRYISDNPPRYRWTTNCQIYIDKFKVSSSGTISVESEQLVSETNTAYGQGLQTQSFSGINLGSNTCSWVIRKATQPHTVTEIRGGSYDMANTLTLNSYSYTTSAETITNPSGEVFYLAIGR